MSSLKCSCLNYSKKLLFYSIFFLAAVTFSQERENYSLLWKIEGQNSDKPSYLFGTMHVTDSRAFKFSDQVLKAIEDTEYFALEINPDSMVTSLSKSVNKPLNLDVFKRVLKKKEYKKLQERFKEIHNISIEESLIGDPHILLLSLLPDNKKEDDKATFVDAYLYTQARTMQKKIVGLELVSAQENYFENLSDEDKRLNILGYISKNTKFYDKYLNELTEVYYSGDINKIENILIKHNSINDETLIDRNKYMVNSMIKLIDNSSVFSAVGAAHLPGEQGIIEILRSKGYKVSVVKADFTGVADNYKVNFNKMKWTTYQDKDLGFSLELPGVPNDSINYKNFNIYSYKGIMNSQLLSFFALDARELAASEKGEEFISNMIDNTVKQINGQLIKKDTLTIKNGVGYKTLTKVNDNNYVKSLIIIKNRIMYYLFADIKSKDLKDSYSEKFFNSFKTSTPNPPSPPKKIEWITYKNNDGAFKLKLPSTPIDVSRTSPNPYDSLGKPIKINLFRTIDLENKNNYIFRYNDMPLGYFLEDHNQGFAGLEQNFKKTSRIVGTAKDIDFNGYSAKEYELYIQDKYHAICRVYFKGNRMFLLLKQKLNETEKVDVNDDFFNSFEFTENKKPELTTYSPNNNFSILTFKERKITPDNTIEDLGYVGNAVEISQLNEANGDVAYFAHNNLKDYFKIKNLDDFYEENVNAIITYRDSLISKTKVKIQGYDGIEAIMRNKSTGLYARHRIWLINNHTYHFQIYAEEDNINNQLADSIINSFKILKPEKPFDIYTSKTKHILKDLKSKDTLLRNSALGAFNYYEFEKEDIDKLFKALEEKSNDSFWIKAKQALISEFQNVNNTSTIKRLESIFLKKTTPEILRIEILRTISNLDYEDAIPTYVKLFNQLPPENNDNYQWSVLSPFKDSLKLANDNFKTLLKVNKLKAYRRDILNTSRNILLDSLIKPDIINSNSKTMLQYAQGDVDTFLTELSDEDSTNDYNSYYLIQSYLNLFDELPNSKELADTFTEKLIGLDDQSWIQFLALCTRLKHDLSVSDDLITTKFEDNYTRFELIKFFHDNNKRERIPEKYLTPLELGKLSLNHYLSEESSYPKTIDLLETFQDKGETYFAFEFSFEDDEDSYVGITGPIKKMDANSEFERYKCYFNWETKKENWKSQVNNMMQDYEKNSY